MRLLSWDGKFVFSEHFESPPPYAILSHTWSRDHDDEVSYNDVLQGANKDFLKLKWCKEQALRDGYTHFWIDTCCIDKSNAAELAYSIRSMYHWYENASVCYVYLSDVSKNTSGGWENAFKTCRWFTRGWTLQELMAPDNIQFFAPDGFLGTKQSLMSMLCGITGIDLRDPSKYDHRTRLSWLQERTTLEPEDLAYCIMGICGVVIRPLYGEGKDSALQRLKLAIVHRYGLVGKEQRQQDLLKMLKFDAIESRRTNIEPALTGTCKWVLSHPAYLQWIRAQHHFFWIKGRPGVGKSVLVKFLDQHVTKKVIQEDDLCLSFYFNARGHQLERTLHGLYRSLLVQLLELLPGLHLAGRHETVEQLQELFAAAVQQCDRRIWCFIDALDECVDEDVNQIIHFFQALPVRVCFASRHYPIIEVPTALQLILEEVSEHANDLGTYIDRNLRVITKSDWIKHEIVRKANGVFLWVVLVIGILRNEMRTGRLHAVRAKLQEVPTGLMELFQDIMRRDRDNMDEFVLCLRWIIYTQRPLSLPEWYFAMMAGCGHKLHWNKDELTLEQMHRFLVTSSKGLAELTRGKATATVQCIHDSVRDFLVEFGGFKLICGGVEHLQSHAHQQLRDCCKIGLSFDMPDHSSTLESFARDRRQEQSHEREVKHRLLGSEHDQQQDTSPFASYAVANILIHANHAASNLSQADFLARFDLPAWTRQMNTIRGYTYEIYAGDTSFTYVCARENLPRLLGYLKGRHSMVKACMQRYKTPLVAAIALKHWDVLFALLEQNGADNPADLVAEVRAKVSSWRACALAYAAIPWRWAIINRLERLAVHLLDEIDVNGLHEHGDLSGVLRLAIRNELQEVVAKLISIDDSLRLIVSDAPTSIRDSAYVSGTLVDTVIENEEDDDQSIRTDGQTYSLPLAVKVRLISRFAEEASKSIDNYSRNVDSSFSQQQLETLLKTFAILLDVTASHDVEKNSVRFVRHQRQAIASKLREYITSDNAQFDKHLKALDHIPGKAGDMDSWLQEAGIEVDQCDLDTTTIDLPAGPGPVLGSQAFGMIQQPDGIDDASGDVTEERVRSTDETMLDDKDIDEAREFLLSSQAFGWFAQQVSHLSRTFNGNGIRCKVQEQIASALGKERKVEHLCLILDWDPRQFLLMQADLGHESISDIIVYCGSLRYGYATTIVEYAVQFWPAIARPVLGCIESALGNGHAQTSIDSSALQVSIAEASTTIGSHGKSQLMLEIADMCIWLTVACRASRFDNRIACASPRLVVTDIDASHRAEIRVEVTEELQECDISSNGGLCWTKMVRNPVLAVGYPIPHRCTDQPGLEMSYSLLLALSAVTWMTLYNAVLVMKGIVSAVVPVAIAKDTMDRSIISWHFLVEEDGKQMCYNTAYAAAAKDISTSALQDLENQRHIVGLWLTSSDLRAGGNDESLYPLEESESIPAREYRSRWALELNSASLTMGKYLSLVGTASFCRKDVSIELEIAKDQPFRIMMRQAADLDVVLYADHANEQRGWLLDGASVLLHLARSWMADEFQHYLDASTFNKYQAPKNLGSRTAAVDALVANRNLDFGLDVTDTESQTSDHDSSYATGTMGKGSIKQQRKTWNFASLVTEVWQRVQIIQSHLKRASDNGPSLVLDSSAKHPFRSKQPLLGWEAQDLLKLGNEIDPKIVELSSHGTAWRHFVQRSGMVVLFARSFGDIILPRLETNFQDVRQRCLRRLPMPSGQCLLAVPLYIWSRRGKRWVDDDPDKHCGLAKISTHSYWHSFDPVIGACWPSHERQCQCSVVSGVGEQSSHCQDAVQNPTEAQATNVFVTYSMGTALIGRYARKQHNHSRKQPKREMMRFISQISGQSASCDQQSGSEPSRTTNNADDIQMDDLHFDQPSQASVVATPMSSASTVWQRDRYEGGLESEGLYCEVGPSTSAQSSIDRSLKRLEQDVSDTDDAASQAADMELSVAASVVTGSDGAVVRTGSSGTKRQRLSLAPLWTKHKGKQPQR